VLNQPNQDGKFDLTITNQEEKLKELRVEYGRIKTDPATEFYDSLPK
jgi:hypothetical protein